jgi:FKBP-type peptidyl-prolyl cis-trans isomerase FklB
MPQTHSVRTTVAFGMGALAATAVGVGLGAGLRAEQPAGATPDKTSYAIGHDLAVATLDRLRIDEVEFDRNALARGFMDVIEDRPAAFTDAEMTGALMVLERKVNELHARQRFDGDPVFKAYAEENGRKSREFIERFKADARSVSLPGGSAYRVRESGDGTTPGMGDTIRAVFEARLIDGTLIGDGEEHRLRVDSMVPGAQELIQKMRVGDRWIVVIPPEQAFGLGGRPPEVGPNQAIVAEVHLVGIGG